MLEGSRRIYGVPNIFWKVPEGSKDYVPNSYTQTFTQNIGIYYNKNSDTTNKVASILLTSTMLSKRKSLTHYYNSAITFSFTMKTIYWILWILWILEGFQTGLSGLRRWNVGE